MKVAAVVTIGESATPGGAHTVPGQAGCGPRPVQVSRGQQKRQSSGGCLLSSAAAPEAHPQFKDNMFSIIFEFPKQEAIVCVPAKCKLVINKSVLCRSFLQLSNEVKFS